MGINQPTSRPTNQQTDWRTKRGVESCSTLLKIISFWDLTNEIFSRVLVTTTRYVGRLVCWPLLAFLAFLAFSGVFCVTAPVQMLELACFITAPAHPHTTSVHSRVSGLVMYITLISFNGLTTLLAMLAELQKNFLRERVFMSICLVQIYRYSTDTYQRLILSPKRFWNLYENTKHFSNSFNLIILDLILPFWYKA